MLAPVERNCDMREGFYNSGHEMRTEDRCSASRSVILWAFLLVSVFGFAGPARAQSSDTPRSPVTSIGPSLQFAIADFDGDRRPDIAYVQAGQGAAGNNSYCVDFRLSSRGRSCFWIFAPSGGLIVEARDVNGDHAVDLVVSTAWFRQPVAVLLNDGHGTFTAATAAAFPRAFQRASGGTFSSHQRFANSLGALTQSRLGVCTELPLSHPLSQTRFCLRLIWATVLPSSFLSRRGRAPPILS
jgi:hypothetical protein